MIGAGGARRPSLESRDPIEIDIAAMTQSSPRPAPELAIQALRAQMQEKRRIRNSQPAPLDEAVDAGDTPAAVPSGFRDTLWGDDGSTPSDSDLHR